MFETADIVRLGICNWHILCSREETLIHSTPNWTRQTNELEKMRWDFSPNVVPLFQPHSIVYAMRSAESKAKRIAVKPK